MIYGNIVRFFVVVLCYNSLAQFVNLRKSQEIWVGKSDVSHQSQNFNRAALHNKSMKTKII